MNINSIDIRGLHGYLNKKIIFNSDLTILVGINGSGKTSVLNIINWMTKPAISELCVLEFKSIELILTVKQVVYKLKCTHFAKSLKLTVESSKGETFYPLTVKTSVHPKNISGEFMLSQLTKEYTSLQPDNREKKTWDLLMTFPNPTIIGLDRNLYVDEYSTEFAEGNLARSKKVIKSSKSPLDKVKEIVNTEYRVKKNDILNLTNQLKDYLIFSAFESGVITADALYPSSKNKISASVIKAAQDKVNDYFSRLEIKQYSETEKNVLNNYFHQLNELIRIFSENKDDSELQMLINLNSVQFRRINKILKKFEEFENSSSTTLVTINKFLSITNSFLKDSAKELVFKEDTAELTFNALDKNSKVIGEFKDLKYLSSGEQQILILFSYLAFNSNDGRIFIIDEPELSLHIKWQEEFLTELERISPKSTQIIVATHSPILVNKKREKVKLLLPYNE